MSIFHPHRVDDVNPDDVDDHGFWDHVHAGVCGDHLGTLPFCERGHDAHHCDDVDDCDSAAYVDADGGAFP